MRLDDRPDWERISLPKNPWTLMVLGVAFITGGIGLFVFLEDDSGMGLAWVLVFWGLLLFLGGLAKKVYPKGSKGWPFTEAGNDESSESSRRDP